MADLTCDNHADCGGLFVARSSEQRTIMFAAAQGWRVWRDEELNLTLCPKCVGMRARRERAPERLEGEQPLF